ncbi:MAG: MBOAT family protein [Rhodospirillales bacterium]|nr:MBOAT family protein [Rhodospirillales bacterium]
MVLVLASLFFYAWWDPPFLALLLVSVVINYGFGVWGCRSRSRTILWFAIAFNLGLIAYFKYAGFLAATTNDVFGTTLSFGQITLPLAISFFTFQQIAYQVDVHRGYVRDTDFIHYCLFVTFFPQLIAGPIVHHREVISQFEDRRRFNLSLDNLSTGAIIFAIGLYKKVVIADGIAPFADSLFDNPAANPTALAAWCGTLAYTMQIYFDFSGYSDMAIGLARVFGIRLPVNFASPYKAASIIEFWQNWHITLSRFLRDYLYIPLGGNRFGDMRRYANLLITMLLGGLWHGAAWTFVVWGGLHGALLAVNHLWRKWRGGSSASSAGRALARALTFLCVVVGWVFFRAETFDGALSVLGGMAGLNGFGNVMNPTGTYDLGIYLWLAVLLAVVWFTPNTQELVSERKPALGFSPTGDFEHNPLWKTRSYWLLIFTLSCGFAALLTVVVKETSTQDFIYMVF